MHAHDSGIRTKLKASGPPPMPGDGRDDVRRYFAEAIGGPLFNQEEQLGDGIGLPEPRRWA